MRIDFTPSPDLYPFASRWHDTPACRVHYIDEGDGPPILFCHGNPTWSFLYRDIVRALRDRFRCVAIDYPGFGLSDRPLSGYGYTIAEHADVVRQIVEHLELDDLVVMGQDWGGPIGAHLASRDPDRIRGVVFGNTWLGPADRPSTRLFARLMSSGPVQRRILEKNLFVERLMPRMAARSLTEEEMEHYRAVQPTPEARRGVAEMPKQILGASAWLSELLPRVRETLSAKPALMLWGMRDPAFRPRVYLPRMQELFPDNRTIELPQAKHFIQEDAPQAIAAGIAERFG